MNTKVISKKSANRTPYSTGQKFGKWTLEKKLGEGGNGEVWQVSSTGLPDHAIKILINSKPESYDRFKIEIQALSTLHDITGIIPLVDKYLPETLKGSKAWFTMPLAQTFEQCRPRMTPQQIAKDFIDLSETLEALHVQGIVHRDIKPDNLLYLNGRLCLSDFGLVKYPERLSLTSETRDVGAKFTMAPEMRRHASKADGIPADIFSFAKSLWIALTNEKLGFDGQYSPNSILALNRYLGNIYTTTLDQLLIECTDNDPIRRPNIAKVRERIAEWLNIANDFFLRNHTEWTELQHKLFPTGAPSRATWTEIDSICTVLSEIANIPALNHMFYPTGGGNTITGASRAPESGMIELRSGGKMAEILKPAKLTYESFDLDSKWNYFRLEAAPIESTGVKGALDSDEIQESLTEISPGKYVSYSHWSDNEYMGQELAPVARPVSRYLKGSFVFFSTSSTYNQNPDTYDARHNEMNEDEFRSYIERNAKHLSKTK